MMESSTVVCPICGSSDIRVADSYTVIDGSSKYKRETRQNASGFIDIAFRPIYSGNKTTYHCNKCNVDFSYKVRDDYVDTIKER